MTHGSVEVYVEIACEAEEPAPVLAAAGVTDAADVAADEAAGHAEQDAPAVAVVAETGPAAGAVADIEDQVVEDDRLEVADS